MPNLSSRKPRISNLGQAFGVVAAASQKSLEMQGAISDDLHAFHAPSECYDIAFGGCDRIVLDATKEAERIAGASWAEIVCELKARTGGRWFAWTMYGFYVPSLES